VGIDMKSIVMADSLEARTTKNVNVSGIGDIIDEVTK
jgi:hypothetical protein